MYSVATSKSAANGPFAPTCQEYQPAAGEDSN